MGDFIQRHDNESDMYTKWDKFMMSLVGISNEGGAPLELRLSFKWPFGNKNSINKIREIYNEDFTKIFIAHGKNVEENAKTIF